MIYVLKAFNSKNLMRFKLGNERNKENLLRGQLWAPNRAKMFAIQIHVTKHNTKHLSYESKKH
jgi:hypothetical protein